MSEFDRFCNLVLKKHSFYSLKNTINEQSVSSAGSAYGPHKGKVITSATGTDGSGKTTVTYSDGTSATFNLPRPVRNNNPGNLEYGDFAKKMGAVGSDGRYAVFPTVEMGSSAKIALLKTSTYQNLSIKDAFNRYAPPQENPNYIRDLQNLTGFDLSRKMSSLNDAEFNTLINAVSKIEGNSTNISSAQQTAQTSDSENTQQGETASNESETEEDNGFISYLKSLAAPLTKDFSLATAQKALSDVLGSTANAIQASTGKDISKYLK